MFHCRQSSLSFRNHVAKVTTDCASGTVDGSHDVGGGAFAGQGRTLAGGPAPSAAGPSQPSPASQQPIVHTITFYNEGVFTVNDGEFALLRYKQHSACTLGKLSSMPFFSIINAWGM